MNWIISKSDKLSCHTVIGEIIEPIKNDIDRFQWLLSDLEYSWHSESFPFNHDHKYRILNPSDFLTVSNSQTQIIWGAFLAIPANAKLEIDIERLPFVEFNSDIWENGNLQHHLAEIEIVCVDSSYTIVKFKDGCLSAKFKEYFPGAIQLEDFR